MIEQIWPVFSGIGIALSVAVDYRFDDAPKRVYWELTRACDLACRHCRASASPGTDPRELTTATILRVLDDLAEAGRPHVILTGGDPLKRRDFFHIVDHARAIGLPCLVAPSATPLLTRQTIRTLASMGITAMSLSLDGSTAARHDALRGIPGTFSRTVELACEIADAGIPLQINTLVTADTVGDLPEIHAAAREVDATRWSLFFLIAVGRGQALHPLDPGEAEAVLNWALDHASHRNPIVTTTEAPHYRRIAVQRLRAQKARGLEPPPQTNPSTSLGTGRPRDTMGFGMRDGNGVMFISHTGEVQPSGFLPLTAGSVRADNPLRIYRESPLFQGLRRPDQFRGPCGHCEFREICGGSRARAYAATGDALGSDPLCSHLPTQ